MHQRRTALLVVLYGLLCVAALSYSQQLFQVQTPQPTRRRPAGRMLIEQSSGGTSLASVDSEAAEPCQKMLWFMGVGGETSLDRLLYLQAALLSAREHAPSLVPLLIYSGAGSGGQGGDNVTAWFEANGGHVVHHTLSFLPDFQRQPNATWRELLLRAEGIYLRLDIPAVLAGTLRAGRLDMANVSTRFALYTDTDVMFVGGGDISTCTQQQPPRLFSLGPESVRGRPKNTGVMLLDVLAFGEQWPRMLEFGRQRNFQFGDAVDQGWVLEYMNATQQELGLLPDSYNWKGYWGADPGVRIFHWHGPKPGRCLPCFLLPKTVYFWPFCHHRDGWSQLVPRRPGKTGCSKNHYQLLKRSADPQGAFYRQMLAAFKAYLAQAGTLELFQRRQGGEMDVVVGGNASSAAATGGQVAAVAGDGGTSDLPAV